jgi:hypothetical protein
MTAIGREYVAVLSTDMRGETQATSSRKPSSGRLRQEAGGESV